MTKREVAIEMLRPVLDRLYTGFNHPDSAADPIQIVRRYERADDREVVAFCAASLAFGRVASVLQSIERLMAIMGDRPAAYVRGFDPLRRKPAFADLVHRWIGGPDVVALLWIITQMIRRSGSIEAFFLEGYDPSAPDITGALDSFSTRALALDLAAAYGRVPRRPGRVLLLPPSVGGQRVQAAESVSALDGASGRAGSRRLVSRRAGKADRAAGYARHPGRPVPAPDPLHEPRVGDGARHHHDARPARSGRSGEVRLLAVPSRDDERLWLQS